MSTNGANGHVKSVTWQPADFAALEELGAPVWVDIFEGTRPPVCIDPRGYDTLVMLGATGNPLIQEAIAAYEDRNRAWAQAAPTDVIEAAAVVRALQDRILAAIVLEPPYAPLDALVDGRPPAGHLWFAAFTREQREGLVAFFYNGAEALKSVRVAAPPGEPAAGDGAGLPPAAESDPDPTGAAVSPLVAGRGAAAGGPPADGSPHFYARDADPARP